MSHDETVRDRFDDARATLTPVQIAMGIGLLALLGVTLLFVQEPMVHDAMHNFRHAAGVTCH
ncbi:cobalamin cluster protein [Halobacteriales archaeon QS_1_68_17]|nr:MAG: cobalamin cluster protein [Halobacteriales archaeon QS_1_68_17]